MALPYRVKRKAATLQCSKKSDGVAQERPSSIKKNGDNMNQISDYIVVGGGAGGCAIAGRLTEDPSISVTVLEAGGTGDSWVVNTPIGVVAMLPTKLNNWAFDTVPQPGLNGRLGYQPR